MVMLKSENYFCRMAIFKFSNLQIFKLVFYSLVIFFTSRSILSAAARCFDSGYSVMKL